MTENSENLDQLIETTKENLWTIANLENLPREEAVRFRELLSRPLGVFVSKNNLSVTKNSSNKIERHQKKK